MKDATLVSDALLIKRRKDGVNGIAFQFHHGLIHTVSPCHCLA